MKLVENFAFKIFEHYEGLGNFARLKLYFSLLEFSQIGNIKSISSQKWQKKKLFFTFKIRSQTTKQKALKNREPSVILCII